MPTIVVSNGEEFYRISPADLPSARADGFYVPRQRGRTIVTDGQQLFEISLNDLEDAQRDGFREICEEDQARSDSTAATLLGIEAADEREIRRKQNREIESATGLRQLQLLLLYRILPTHQQVRELVTTYGTATLLVGFLLVLLAFWFLKPPPEPDVLIVETSWNDALNPPDEEAPPIDVQQPDPSPLNEETQIASEELANEFQINIDALPPSLVNVDPPGRDPSVSAAATESLAGRSKAGRMSAVTKYGGSAASESAVELALQWLARHQLADGSWAFNHTRHAACRCSQPGEIDGRIGATGLAVITFLGAGHTYAHGDFKSQVENAIRFLLNNVRATPNGYAALLGSDGSHAGIYQHGIATTALCEALAMTDGHIRAQRSDRTVRLTNAKGRRLTMRDLTQNERTLRQASQLAMNYIAYHQDPGTGGFSYAAKRPNGTTSILGWQLLALASGKAVGLRVPQATWRGIVKFLDSVQLQQGAFYGYETPKLKASTTAIGLLCRMYQGWDTTHPALAQGVRFIGDKGPSPRDIYYDYYATQLMFHWGDDGQENLWSKWNNVMRPQLVQSQIKEGHEAGSWNITDASDPQDLKGGRLYQTCLATMTLEVYYRKLPLYQRLDTEPTSTNATTAAVP